MVEGTDIAQRALAPAWLRALTGMALFPAIGLALLLLVSWVTDDTPVTIAAVTIAIAGVAAWLWARRQSTTGTWVSLGLAVLVCAVLGSLTFTSVQETTVRSAPSMTTPTTPPPPPTGAPLPSPASPPLPEFPWPPPAASASYVLPDSAFQGRQTVGEAVGALIAALERSGYVDRSFFRTQAGGVALVTRLERIDDDGSSLLEPERWATLRQLSSSSSTSFASTADLGRFLRGLFFVDPGHYRVIVFVLQDLSFSQSSQTITGDEALAWLKGGANVLPAEIARRPFGNAHGTALIYEFASDGTAVRLVESRLTGRGHLEKARLSSLFGVP